MLTRTSRRPRRRAARSTTAGARHSVREVRLRVHTRAACAADVVGGALGLVCGAVVDERDVHPRSASASATRAPMRLPPVIRTALPSEIHAIVRRSDVPVRSRARPAAAAAAESAPGAVERKRAGSGEHQTDEGGDQRDVVLVAGPAPSSGRSRSRRGPSRWRPACARQRDRGVQRQRAEDQQQAAAELDDAGGNRERECGLQPIWRKTAAVPSRPPPPHSPNSF